MKLRKIPPVCLFVSIIRLINGKLCLSKKNVGIKVNMDDQGEFEIFRHITKYPLNNKSENCVFVVSFKFAKLSHQANKLASIIPMLLITGFPGFMTKMYGVNHDSGFWQGMYQWKSKQHLEEYKNSFVYRMMNKRAIKSSIQSFEIDATSLANFIQQNKI